MATFISFIAEFSIFVMFGWSENVGESERK